MKGWPMIHKIKSMYDEGKGYSKKQIARELSISRKTVKKYLKMKEEEIVEYLKDAERQKKLDRYKEYIEHLLRKYPKLTAVKIKRKLETKIKEEAASERTYRNYVNRLKETIAVKQKRYYEPVIDMVAGVQSQVDPGEIRGVMIGGIPTTIYFVVFVLSYSRLMHVAVSDRPINTSRFIQMHDEAFSHFAGVVEECVYDQTKLVVIKEEYREVWFNEEFSRYAVCAGFDIRVCEGYDPESKGKVEAGVKYVKNDFFYGEEFGSMQELKEELMKWSKEVANLRVHGTTKKKPAEVYETEEREKMKPYLRPSFLSEDDTEEVRTADKTSLISHKSNKYSVPMNYQSSNVLVKEEGQKLEIRDIRTKEVIAEHTLSNGKGEIIKNTNHYRDYKKMISDKEREIGEITGKEVSEEILKVIKATSPKIYKDQLAGLITVLKQYREKESLQEVLKRLSERNRLTVTFIRDYLGAVYTERELSTVVESSGESIGMLAVYGNLLTKPVCVHRTGREADAHGKL